MSASPPRENDSEGCDHVFDFGSTVSKPHTRSVEAHAPGAGISLVTLPPEPLTGSSDPLTFRRSQAAERGRPGARATGSHLDDGDQIILPGHDIELQMTESQIARNDREAMLLEVLDDGLLGALAKLRAHCHGRRSRAG